MNNQKCLSGAISVHGIRLLCLSILMLASLIPVSAQQSVTFASLSGWVEDAGGAVVSGAVVTVTNLDKNLNWTVNSDDQGRYRFLYLPVGNYQVKATARGFAPIEQRITLTVGQSLNIPLRLQVSGVTIQVNIVSGADIIETVRTQVAETVSPREIENLPLNGRNYLDLAALTPAVTRANPVANQRFAETSAVPGAQINIAGQRNINNGFVIDGLSANDDAADLPGTFFSQEVIGEFQVITSGGIAEFGRASAGIVNVITRSGSNEWNGKAYGYLSNQRLNARNPLSTAKGPYTQSQYGASLGGPLRRDRTFLFANFEQTRLNNATVVTILPANVTAINTVLDQIKYTGPRVSTGLVPTGYDTSNFFLRGDHRLSEFQLTIGSLQFLATSAGVNARGVGGLSATSRGTSLDNRDQTFALSEVATLSPNTANEARFQYTHSRLVAPANDLTGPAWNNLGRRQHWNFYLFAYRA
ncbi:MAG: TonB-dependent receptor [Acidobacteria bacterium]|nr:TonB-dependent receptor [Acidobacteriota bacterium]